MLTPGNLVFAANYRRAANSRPYGRFPAVCKKDSGIDWWSNIIVNMLKLHSPLSTFHTLANGSCLIETE